MQVSHIEWMAHNFPREQRAGIDVVVGPVRGLAVFGKVAAPIRIAAAEAGKIFVLCFRIVGIEEGFVHRRDRRVVLQPRRGSFDEVRAGAVGDQVHVRIAVGGHIIGQRIAYGNGMIPRLLGHSGSGFRSPVQHPHVPFVGVANLLYGIGGDIDEGRNVTIPGQLAAIRRGEIEHPARRAGIPPMRHHQGMGGGWAVQGDEAQILARGYALPRRGGDEGGADVLVGVEGERASGGIAAACAAPAAEDRTGGRRSGEGHGSSGRKIPNAGCPAVDARRNAAYAAAAGSVDAGERQGGCGCD